MEVMGMEILIVSTSMFLRVEQERGSNDPNGIMLEILKGMHEATFKDNKAVIVEGSRPTHHDL
jgi:hypothetical protein